MDWRLQQRIEREYQQALARLTGVFVPSQDEQKDPEAWSKMLMDKARIEWFKAQAQQAVKHLVANVNVANAKTWREAARKSMQGRMIYEALQKEMRGDVGRKIEWFVANNAELISTFPHNMAQRVNQHILKAAQQGTRSETLAKQLRKQFPHIMKSRLTLIARTETSKCSTALTRARSEELGADWWVWRTSKDQRVRESHRKMNDVLVAWYDLPSPEALVGEKNVGRYAAGDIWNCRCYPEPLLRWDQVRWPHRVYHSGTIKVMTLSEFKQLGASAPTSLAA